MMDSETGEQWTAMGVPTQFIRGCKHLRIIVMMSVSW